MKPNPINDDALDRLVDGELTETRRKEVLLKLGDEPNGWRRCAMAFLQAQAWTKDLGSLTSRPDLGMSRLNFAVRQRPTFVRRLATIMAVAAGFIIALFIGFRTQEMLNPRGVDTSPGANFVASDEMPRPSDDKGANDKWQTVTLVSNNGPKGNERPFRLPVTERDNFDITQTPNTLPPDVLRSLRQAGHDVRQSRQFIPLKMKDGRQLVVPVDEVELRPVKREVY